MQQNNSFSFPHFLLYILSALVIGVPFALAFPVSSTQVALTRICNGLFFGGMLVAAWGCIAAATNLGGFSLIAYANKKVWQVLLKRGNIPEEKKLGSYFDYLQSRKKKREVLEMIFAGLIPMAVSLVLSFVFFF